MLPKDIVISECNHAEVGGWGPRGLASEVTISRENQ
jgi:hypothetical protein